MTHFHVLHLPAIMTKLDAIGSTIGTELGSVRFFGPLLRMLSFRIGLRVPDVPKIGTEGLIGKPNASVEASFARCLILSV